MSKNIVVCCDGTGNEVGQNISNVLKLYRVLRKTGKTPRNKLFIMMPASGRSRSQIPGKKSSKIPMQFSAWRQATASMTTCSLPIDLSLNIIKTATNFSCSGSAGELTPFVS